MLKNFFAGLLVFLFVSVSLPIGIVFAMKHTLNDQELYKGELVDVVYTGLVEKWPESVDYSGLSIIDEQLLRDVLVSVVREEDVGQMIDAFIEQATEARADGGVVTFTIPFDWFVEKTDLMSEEIAGYLYENLETCAVPAEESLEPIDYFSCVPADIAEIDFVNALRFDLDSKLFSNVPDELTFALNVPNETDGPVLETFAKMINKILFLGLALQILILVILSAVMFRPPSKLSKWLAKAFFSASTMLIIALVSLRSLLSSDTVVTALGEYSYMIGFVEFLGSAMLAKMLIYLLPISILSLIILIVSIRFLRDQEGEPQ